MVEAQTADFPGAILHCQRQVLVALELRHEVDRRVLPPVDLALRQCRRCSGRVGNEVPHNAIDVDDLRTGIEARLAVLARNVFVVLLIDDTLAGNTLGRDELEGAAADGFRHLLHRVGLRQPLRHDRAINLPERIGQQCKRLLQAEADHLVGGRRKLIGACHQGAAERIALGEALDRRDAIARQNRRAVVEDQSVAQRQIPLLSVIADDVALDHLRLYVEVRIVAVERVVHGEREVARDVRRRPHRIE